MSKTYGPNFKFIVFDIRINFNDTLNDKFLDVSDAEIMAIRNGIGNGRVREGIVVKPIHEGKMSNDERAILMIKTSIIHN